MCGRFVRAVSIEDIADEFGVDIPSFDLSPSYNIAPSQDIAIVMKGEKKTLRSANGASSLPGQKTRKSATK
jgi:putative SOS response-associated peptidase YedK